MVDVLAELLMKGCCCLIGVVVVGGVNFRQSLWACHTAVHGPSVICPPGIADIVWRSAMKIVRRRYKYIERGIYKRLARSYVCQMSDTYVFETARRDVKLVHDIPGNAHNNRHRHHPANVQRPFRVFVLGAQHIIVAQQREHENHLRETQTITRLDITLSLRQFVIVTVSLALPAKTRD